MASPTYNKGIRQSLQQAVGRRSKRVTLRSNPRLGRPVETMALLRFREIELILPFNVVAGQPDNLSFYPDGLTPIHKSVNGIRVNFFRRTPNKALKDGIHVIGKRGRIWFD